MKQGIILLKHFSYLLFALLLLNSCSNLEGKKKNLKEDKETSNNINLNSKQSTFLYCTKASERIGELELQGGNNMTWKGSSSLTWDVDISTKGKYELYLIANVRKEGVGRILSFKTNTKAYNYELEQTSGPYRGGRNFERIKLSSKIELNKGMQKLTLQTEGISTEDILLDIRSIELLPVAAKKQIEKEYQRAVESRANVGWLKEAGYGLMFHWTSQSIQPDGTIKKYEDAVNEFDVDKFANMVNSTGAGYVMLTIGHAESYCPAPIKSWEKVHPGHTTKRDLIVEIADSLNKHGIRLICYINGPLGFNLDVKRTTTDEEKEDFVVNFKNILHEMGSRYEQKIAGYWFDSWYQIFEEFPNVPFEEFNKAAKVGNENRIICLNSWIYPPVSPWQDYWAGEVASPVEIPENGYSKNGPVTDLPYQALLIMEPYWVQQKVEMPDPRFSSEKLSKYIQDCMENGGAVTVNLGIYQDGTVGEKALQVMKEVKETIRGAKSILKI